jgi:hypothetical protein
VRLGRLAEQFGAAAPDSRGVEWRRLGLFLAFGTAFFLLAVVVAAFPHVATGRGYAAMLAIVGIVMAATAAAIFKGRGVGRSGRVAG